MKKRTLMIIAKIVIALFLFIALPMGLSQIGLHKAEVTTRILDSVIQFTVPNRRITGMGTHADVFFTKANIHYATPVQEAIDFKYRIPNILGNTQIEYTPIKALEPVVEIDLKNGNTLFTWLQDQALDRQDLFLFYISFIRPLDLNVLDSFINEADPEKRFTWLAADYPSAGKKSTNPLNYRWGFPLAVGVYGQPAYKEYSVYQAAADFHSESRFILDNQHYLGKNSTINGLDLNELEELLQYSQDQGIKVRGIVIGTTIDNLLRYPDQGIFQSISVIKKI